MLENGGFGLQTPCFPQTSLSAHTPKFGGCQFHPLNFGGRPPENTVKQGVSGTPPPKFRGVKWHPLNFGGAISGLQGLSFVRGVFEGWVVHSDSETLRLSGL